jgi:hypothetical protein
LHWPYHPKGLERWHLRRLYDEILKPLHNYDNMQIAVSIPKNLREILTRTALSPADSAKIMDMINEAY